MNGRIALLARPGRIAAGLLGLLALASTADAQHSTSRNYGNTAIKMILPDGASLEPEVACDGCLLVYSSEAQNLVPGDVNGVEDVFYVDPVYPVPTLASRTPLGVPGNGRSWDPEVSGDCRWIVFSSDATDLTASADGNGLTDVFLHEVATGEVTRVSVDLGGGDANGASTEPSISYDGRYVAFTSTASDLVSGDTNGARDVFVRDLLTDVTVRVSVNNLGVQGNDDSRQPAIDGAGSKVVFASVASNLVGGDGNGVEDVFLRRLLPGFTERLSDDPAGNDANGASFQPSISCNGDWVAYTTFATDLFSPDTNGSADVVVEDLALDVRSVASVNSSGNQANGHSRNPSISNGGQVVYQSMATNLVTGDGNGARDVFVHASGSGATFRASVDRLGVEGNGDSVTPDISADGCDVVFSSEASNLDGPDGNGVADVFAHRHAPQCVTLQFDPELPAIPGPLTLQSGGGDPNRKLALFLVAIDGTPFPLLVGLFSYDATGTWTLNTAVPNDPALDGLVNTWRAFTLKAGSGVRASNLAFFQANL